MTKLNLIFLDKCMKIKDTLYIKKLMLMNETFYKIDDI